MPLVRLENRQGTTARRTGLALGALCLLLAAAPLAIGASPAGSPVTASPPFKGTVTPTDYTSVTGCGHVRVAVPAFFSLHTGASGFAGLASSRSCLRSPSSEGTVQGDYGAAIVLPHHGGRPTVYANGSFTLTAGISLAPGNCTLHPSRSHYSYCDRVSSISVYGYPFLLDKTTGRVTYSSTAFPSVNNATYNDTFCSSTGCANTTTGSPGSRTVSVSTPFSLTFSPKYAFNKTDKLVLEILVYAQVAATCTAYQAALQGCSASTSLNFANLGNGATLVSVVLA
jgi:hypothetical protein